MNHGIGVIMADKPIKAVALISGGLDSMLAAKVILEQGIQVEGINFFTGFCVEGHTHAIRKQDTNKLKRNNPLWVAEQLGIKLHFIDIVEEYKSIVISPKHGYGANLNPCLDCKIFMVKQAKLWAEQHNFDFIITGEVIGQRPKSQSKKYMPIVSEESGIGERLLRPLCAKNLPPSLPEKLGWVDREKLYDFSGRSRKGQFSLADKYQIKDYSQPAGGCCFLTDKYYSKKLADFWQHKTDRDYQLDDIMLLKVGRHLRFCKDFKLIVGREEGENNFLTGYARQFVHLKTLDYPGPLTLLDGVINSADDLHLAARLAARFSQAREIDQAVAVEINWPNQQSQILSVKPLPVDQVKQEWYI